jgi:CheY-like chemotaxis protein
MNLSVAEGLLASYGLTVDTALTGREALEKIKTEDVRYDAVFMDHLMPEMDGMETVKRIRELNTDYAREVPIIALTANAISGTIEKFLANGFNDYLSKPIDIMRLDSQVNKWIRDRQPEDVLRKAEESVLAMKEVLTGSAESESDTTAMPNIDGVDTAVGIANIGGGLLEYTRILKTYRDDVNEIIPQIVDALNSGDISRYVTLVHAVKGTSRTIGAASLGDIAEELENAGKSNESTSIQKNTGAFLERLTVLIKNISAALEHIAQNDESALSVAELNLKPLKDALNGFEIETINKLLSEYASMPLDAETRNVIREIEQNVLLFEYDKAIERINALPH